MKEIIPLKRFSVKSLSSSALLLIVTVLAMIVANTPLAGYYNDFFSAEIQLRIGEFNLFAHGNRSMTLLEFINDGLMTFFFFLVGLEIKREVLVGELSSFRQAFLPIIAACGGMIVPVILFRLIAPDYPESVGSAIPMATDIAFALGVLGLLGDRVPLSLKVFLMAFAVVDDIGGIIVIALFYSSGIVWSMLIASMCLLALLIVANYYHISSKLFYILIGLVIWGLFFKSGIHSTISGVLVAFCIPARPRIDVGNYVFAMRERLALLPEIKSEKGKALLLTNTQIAILKQLESASDEVISPLQDMEDNLHDIVNYLIMPLFAFANAGISLNGFSLDMFTHGVTLAAMIGLVVGKFIGIYFFTWAVIRLKLVQMPIGMNWSNLLGVAMLGGIGFTVSLFIANLSYGDIPEVGSALLNQVKIGVLCGSVIAGLLGVSYLQYILPKKKKI